MTAHVKSLVASMSVVDGDALLSPQLLDRIVTAVLQALEAQKTDEHSRKRDTRIGGGCCDACDDGEGGR